MSPTAVNFLAFESIRWFIFKPISAIQVLDDAGDATSTLRPFIGHPIASAMATLTNPPRTVLQVDIDFSLAILEATDEDPDDEDVFRAPEPLVVRNPDGSPITVGDFIAAVHPYLQALKKEIINCGNFMWAHPPPDTQYYLRDVHENEVDPERDDTGEMIYVGLCFDWERADEHWTRQAETVRSRRQHGYEPEEIFDALAALDALAAGAPDSSWSALALQVAPSDPWPGDI